MSKRYGKLGWARLQGQRSNTQYLSWRTNKPRILKEIIEVVANGIRSVSFSAEAGLYLTFTLMSNNVFFIADICPPLCNKQQGDGRNA